MEVHWLRFVEERDENPGEVTNFCVSSKKILLPPVPQPENDRKKGWLSLGRSS
jgi:hypothetical protein